MAVNVDTQFADPTDDATSLQNNTAFTTTGTGGTNTWLGLTRQGTTASASDAGWRIKLPADVAASEILAATLRITLNGTNAGMSGVSIVVEPGPAAPWAAGANTPTSRYNAAITAGATPVNWDVPAEPAGVRFPTADFAAGVRAAMDHPDWDPATSYIGVIARAPLGANNTLQIMSRDNTANPQLRPYLRLRLDRVPTYDPIDLAGVAYTDGVGFTGGQVFDITVPGGEPPEGGWPFVVWLHGGGWRETFGSKAKLWIPFRDYVNGLGYAFINSEYPMVQQDILVADNRGPSHPMPVLAMRTLMKFLTENAEEYRVNPERGVITGESAGGHVAVETVLTQDDTHVYTGYQNPQGNRNANADQPGTTPPQFNFDRGLVTHPFLGAFVWVAPIDLEEASKNPNPVGELLVYHLARTGYMGAKQGTLPAFTNNELDLNDLIAGTGVYSGHPHPPQVPLGYVRSDGDLLVIKSAGEDAIVAAVTGLVETPPVGYISAEGLSRYVAAGTIHETAQRLPASWDFFAQWLGVVVEGDPPPQHLVGVGIASTEASGTGVVRSLYALNGIGIASTEASGTGSITVGPLNLDGIGLETAEASGEGYLQVGGVILQGIGVPTAEAHGSGTLTVGPVHLAGVGIPTAEAHGVGTLLKARPDYSSHVAVRQDRTVSTRQDRTVTTVSDRTVRTRKRWTT